MTTLNDVLMFIRSTTDGKSLDAIQEATVASFRLSQAIAATRFRSGMAVKFTSKHGYDVTGVIQKVNRSSIDVKSNDGTNRTWRVSPGLLSPA